MLCMGNLQPYSQALTRMDVFATDEHSSLLQTFINYDRKKFYNILHSSDGLCDIEQVMSADAVTFHRMMFHQT
jgi:hypothetical protein